MHPLSVLFKDLSCFVLCFNRDRIIGQGWILGTRIGFMATAGRLTN